MHSFRITKAAVKIIKSKTCLNQKSHIHVLWEVAFIFQTHPPYCWKGSITVSFNGDVYPCVFSREVLLGNVLSTTIKEIINSQKLREFREFSYKSWLNKNGKENSDCSPDRYCKPDSPDCYPGCHPASCNPSCAPPSCSPWLS